MQTFSASLLFSKVAAACGDNLTRRRVYDNALKQTDWTGGGLSAPRDVENQDASAAQGGLAGGGVR